MKLPETLSGNKYLLVIVDAGSREIALEALPTKGMAKVAKGIMNRMYLRGKSPRVWQSDNSKEFTSEVMKELAKLLGAKFKHSSPYHPQTNTHVEHYVLLIFNTETLMNLLFGKERRNFAKHRLYTHQTIGILHKLKMFIQSL